MRLTKFSLNVSLIINYIVIVLLYLKHQLTNDPHFHSMPDHATLAQMVQPGSPYFYAELPHNVKLFHRVRKGFPIQFGREVLSSPEILNIPDRVDWRPCVVGKDQESQMTLEFREMFKTFDFTLE